MKLKKIMALLLASVMTLSLVACGGGNSTDTNGDGDDKFAHLDWSKGATADGGDVTLRVETWRIYDKDYYAEIEKRFEEKYDWIDIEFKITPDANSYYSNIQADLQTGEAPDIFDSHPNDRLLIYADEGLLAPQTDFDYMENYKDEAKMVTTLYGENFGYMNAYNYFGFMYNKDIFEKVGVEVPTNPDDFVAVVDKLKAAGYGGVVVAGTTFAYSALADASFLSCLGTEGYASLKENIDNGTVTDISEVEGVPEALDTLQTYTQKELYYNAWEGMSYEAGNSLFAQGKAAIMYGGSYLFGEKEHFANMNVGYFPFPTYAETGITYAEGAQTTLITTACENLGAAKLWVEFLASPEISEYYCTSAEMMPTMNGIEVETDNLKMINENITDFALKAIQEPENSEYWSTGFNKIYEGVVVNGEDWKSLVKMYASKLEEYDLGSL